MFSDFGRVLVSTRQREPASAHRDPTRQACCSGSWHSAWLRSPLFGNCAGKSARASGGRVLAGRVREGDVGWQSITFIRLDVAERASRTRSPTRGTRCVEPRGTPGDVVLTSEHSGKAGWRQVEQVGRTDGHQWSGSCMLGGPDLTTLECGTGGETRALDNRGDRNGGNRELSHGVNVGSSALFGDRASGNDRAVG